MMKSVRSAEYGRELAREQTGRVDSPPVGRVRVLSRTIIWCDSAFAEMFGYTPRELMGKPTRLLHPTDQVYTAFRDAAFPTIARGEIFRTELQQRRKDGTLGWYDISVGRSAPGSDEQKGAFIDITAHRCAWLDVLEAEERYRNLFVAMVEGVVVHAQNGQIIEANPAAERILRLSRDQLLGKNAAGPRVADSPRGRVAFPRRGASGIGYLADGSRGEPADHGRTLARNRIALDQHQFAARVRSGAGEAGRGHRHVHGHHRAAADDR
ncbi:MAG: PAS domain S-box protein [Steroidobacteraceae bacterium]